MEQIRKTIKDHKPTIGDSTLRTYVSMLNSFYYKHHKKEEAMKLAWFSDQSKIIDLLKDSNINSRKTMLAALIALEKNNELYKKAMMKDIDSKKAETETQTKSETQQENWMDYGDIIKKVDAELAKCMPLLESKAGELDTAEMSKLTLLVVLCLTTGKYIPPRRNMDYNVMKYKNYNEKEDNYVIINHHKQIYNLVFNKYKTDKTYHKQEIEIPVPLRAILMDFIRHKDDSEGDYLLTKRNGSNFQNNDIGKLLETFFKKKIGTSMLRHIYLSNLYKDVPALEQMNKTAAEMGHSTNMALQYVKK
jgi:hypothetical protein